MNLIFVDLAKKKNVNFESVSFTIHSLMKTRRE